MQFDPAHIFGLLAPPAPGVMADPVSPQLEQPRVGGGLLGGGTPGTFPQAGGGFGDAMQTAAPLLLSMGQNLMTPPQQRDPQALQRGLLMMGQQTAQKQERERRAALSESMRQMLGQLPPEQRQAFGVLMQSDPEKAAEFLARLQVAQAGRAQQTVNVAGDAVDTRPITGTPPTGFQRRWDEEAGTWVDEPIPGGEAAREIAAEEAKREGAADSRRKYQDVTFQDITRGIKLVEGQSLLNPVTGLTGLVASVVPGSARANYDALAETITANVSFDRLDEMRQNSPTGGAVGGLSDSERQALGATLGSISTWQDEDQLIANLKRLQAQVMDAVHGPGFWKERGGTLYLKTPQGWVEVEGD